jgi:hypothetical protein
VHATAVAEITPLTRSDVVRQVPTFLNCHHAGSVLPAVAKVQHDLEVRHLGQIHAQLE